MIDTSTLIITPEILSLVAEIDEFKGAWRAVGRLAPERLAALRRVATIESIGASTRLDGGALSDREIERLLPNLNIKRLETRDEQEVAGHAEALELVLESWAELRLSEADIKQLHWTLLRYCEQETHRGKYKTAPKLVPGFDAQGRRSGAVMKTATPAETPRLMAELLTWTNEALSAGALHPLLLIAIFVAVYLDIHPFQEGDGHLSRILTTLLLLRTGYAYIPYGSLNRVMEEKAEGYYPALRQTQGSIRSGAPDWQPWVLFFLRAMERQAARLGAKVEREKLLHSSLPKLSARILDHARDHGTVKIGEMVRLTHASRNTLKEHFRLLVKRGHLAMHGSGRGAWYSLV